MDELKQIFIPPSRIDLAREADFTLGTLRIRPSRREVEDGGVRRVLQRRVMQVLVALAQSTSEVVSQRELVVRCWDGLSVTDDAIGRCIAQLRRLAASWPEPPFEIETIAGVGYRLDPSTARAATTTLALSNPADAPEAASPNLRIGRWRGAAAGAVLLLLVAGAAWFFSKPPRDSPAASVRVAVLPLDATGPGARGFADTLADEVVGVLSTNQVETVSRADSMAVRGPGAGDQLARLGVGLVLDGIVTSDGQRLSVRVHLEDPRSHATLWSKVFSASTRDADALQTQVADQVAEITLVAASRADQGLRKDPLTLAEHLEAVDDSIANVEPGRTLALSRDVVARAPGFAAGHAMLATAIQGDLLALPADDRPGAIAESIKEAKQALTLDPTAADAYLALAEATPFSAWGERERLLLKVLEAHPNNPIGRFLYSDVLLEVGRPRDALAQAQLAQSIMPLAPDPRTRIALAQMLANRPDEAAATVQDAQRIFGDNPGIAILNLQVAGWSGRQSRALALCDDPAVISAFRDLGGSLGLQVWRASLQAMVSGESAQKRAAAGVMTKAAQDGAVDAGGAVAALSSLGDLDGAFRTADQFLTPATLGRPSGMAPATVFLFAPAAAPLRHDPRFMKLAARIGLLDYWHASGHWPDFCAEPGLPYNCKAEAAKLALWAPS